MWAEPYRPAKGRSRLAAKPHRCRDSDGHAGIASPFKTLAFERWSVHAITAYQRWISSKGSRPNMVARQVAKRFVNDTVFWAQKPRRSKERATKINDCTRRWRASKTGRVRCFALADRWSRALLCFNRIPQYLTDLVQIIQTMKIFYLCETNQKFKVTQSWFQILLPTPSKLLCKLLRSKLYYVVAPGATVKKQIFFVWSQSSKR